MLVLVPAAQLCEWHEVNCNEKVYPPGRKNGLYVSRIIVMIDRSSCILVYRGINSENFSSYKRSVTV